MATVSRKDRLGPSGVGRAVLKDVSSRAVTEKRVVVRILKIYEDENK
jgi:hypothetical protein